MNERALWLAWSQIPSIGPVLLQRLQKYFGTLVSAWEASAADLRQVEGVGPQTIDLILPARRQIDPEALLHQHQQTNPDFWTPADTDYPRLLLELPDPPAVLYYRGQVQRCENLGLTPAIALVGTRSPSEYGRRWTRRFATALAQNGFTVVSGLAEGIDAEAHRACLAATGRTIAVVGTGVNVVYPASNRTLCQQVLEQGLVLSEYPAGTQPDRAHFPRRNRIIAGLSRAVLVLEAPKKSGALITAHLANEYGRDVYVLPGSLDNGKSIGCLTLASKGAQILLGEEHLLELLGTLPQLDSRPGALQTQLPLNLVPELAEVLQTLTELCQQQGGEAVPLDAIVQASGTAVGSVFGALIQLELQGLITELPGKRYQRQ